MSIYTFKCHETYGPIVPVKISHSDPRRSNLYYRDMNALIDTGADRTAIDEEIAKRLCLSTKGSVAMKSIGGFSEHTEYSASVQIFAADSSRYVTFKSGSVLGYERYRLPEYVECIIGRDILGLLILTYNGKEKMFSLEL